MPRCCFRYYSFPLLGSASFLLIYLCDRKLDCSKAISTIKSHIITCVKKVDFLTVSTVTTFFFFFFGGGGGCGGGSSVFKT